MIGPHQIVSILLEQGGLPPLALAYFPNSKMHRWAGAENGHGAFYGLLSELTGGRVGDIDWQYDALNDLVKNGAVLFYRDTQHDVHVYTKARPIDIPRDLQNQIFKYFNLQPAAKVRTNTELNPGAKGEIDIPVYQLFAGMKVPRGPVQRRRI